MKQVTQRLRDGSIDVIDVPAPTVSEDTVLVDVRASVLSAGTERTKVETGRKNLVQKARARPDQVRQVMEKAQRDGVAQTVRAVRTRLSAPSELGYSASGIVLSVGSRVRALQPGDRVACGGAGYAVHAEIDQVPGNLCVPVPTAVTFEQAAFATVGSIALHGIRQADVRLGERIAVIGLGLIGQLAGQMLRASGCTVVGIDLDSSLVDLALRTAAIDVGQPRDTLEAKNLPDDFADCDAVIITAATKSTDPITFAAALARDRGRVVVVGDVGLDIPRTPYYEKELDLRLSRSYGPGRYDRSYEERGLDYPIGYVRWTEQRNMAAFLDLVAGGRVDVGPLITGRVPVEDSPAAYDRLLEPGEPALGIVLTYGPTALPLAPSPAVAPEPLPGSATAAVIGTGSFAQQTLIPALRDAGFDVVAVASQTGRSAQGAAESLGIPRASSTEELLAGPAQLAVIATRHDTHAPLALAALESGKAVFVEKPPALTAEELDLLEHAVATRAAHLFVGFNRRHAPLAQTMREHVMRPGQATQLLFRVNAGQLPDGHWLNDLDEGGGRLVGEGCHFVDFACWFVGGLPSLISCSAASGADAPVAGAESFAIELGFSDGSLATILYGDRGASGLPKEYIEAHAGGRSALLTDFSQLVRYSGSKRPQRTRRGKDKGHRAQFRHVRDVLGGGAPSTPLPLATMRVTLAALQAAQTGHTVSL